MLGTYDLCRLAQEVYRERVRQSEWKEVEGVTVWVPTLLDRIALVLRAALASRIQKVRQSSMRWTQSDMMAKTWDGSSVAAMKSRN